MNVVREIGEAWDFAGHEKRLPLNRTGGHPAGTGRRRFEDLVSELTRRFARTPDRAIDGEIERALRQTAEHFELDEGVLLEWTKDGSEAVRLHSWTAPGGVAPPRSAGPALVPWMHQQTLQGRIVMFSRLEDLPPEAAKDREFFRSSGRTALLTLPLKIGPHVIGALALASLRLEVPWTEEIIRRAQCVADILAGALDRRRKQQDADARLRFEALLADTSVRLVNLPPELVEGAILDAQSCLCEALGLDRSSLWYASGTGPDDFVLAHCYPPLENSSAPRGVGARDLFPWVCDSLLARKTVVIPRLSDLPPEATRDVESFRSLGTVSSVVIPLARGGTIVGALTFASVLQERAWPEDLVRRFELVAGIFAEALARARADKTLREREVCLAMATDLAGIGLWSFDPQTSRYWATPRGWELIDRPSNANFTLEDFLRTVHPDDREGLRTVLEFFSEPGETFDVEYRVVPADGKTRWIASRGGILRDPSGGPGLLMSASLDVTERKWMEDQLRHRLEEIERLKLEIEQENVSLRGEISLLSPHGTIAGRSLAMKKVLHLAEVVAQADATVLLTGETGTGKDLIARAIHDLSPRRERALVAVNCAALPANLVEAELFGHEKGAYTGAMAKIQGRFEVADGATLFLDEIGELPLEIQAKLLRVLEDGCFQRLGSPRSVKVNVRIIAATNQDLEELVRAGRFRRDLFYRLNVFPIHIPPLRERPDDIPDIVWAFVRQFEGRMRKRIEVVRKQTMDALQRYAWPGNARQLRNVIEHAMILSPGKTLEVQLPEVVTEHVRVESPSLRDFEREHILGALARTGGRIMGDGGAAELLGLKRTTLYGRMKKLGIDRATR